MTRRCSWSRRITSSAEKPECVDFALKHDLIKNNDDDKTIYDAILSEEYASAKTAEQEEQQFAQEKEAAQKLIGTTLAEFADVVGTMQDIYGMEPSALWWSANQPVLTEAANKKSVLDRKRKFMTPEQLDKFQKLVKRYNQMMSS